VKHGERLARVAQTTSSDDFFMEILHASEKELTFETGTCLFPTGENLGKL